MLKRYIYGYDDFEWVVHFIVDTQKFDVDFYLGYFGIDYLQLPNKTDKIRLLLDKIFRDVVVNNNTQSIQGLSNKYEELIGLPLDGSKHLSVVKLSKPFFEYEKIEVEVKDYVESKNDYKFNKRIVE